MYLENILIISLIIFLIGCWGLFVNRRNILILLMVPCILYYPIRDNNFFLADLLQLKFSGILYDSLSGIPFINVENIIFLIILNFIKFLVYLVMCFYFCIILATQYMYYVLPGKINKVTGIQMCPIVTNRLWPVHSIDVLVYSTCTYISTYSRQTRDGMCLQPVRAP